MLYGHYAGNNKSFPDFVQEEKMQGNITDEMRTKWKKQIAFLEEHQDRLSEWELGFVDSVGNGKDLSLKQSFKLGEIYRRIRDV
jgi:hypothetical protein